ncbi:MAG TPA: hypothetical protein VH740_23490 [Vicinamibacterales bacterium]|jgi:hypothetical protein
MTDINKLLKDADPLRDDDGLSCDEAQAIRREMMGAIPDPLVTVPAWRRPLTIAAAAALILGVSGAVGHRTSSTVSESSAPDTPTTALGSSGTRQLRFATPGGTRIIWIFDPNLRLQESMP